MSKPIKPPLRDSDLLLILIGLTLLIFGVVPLTIYVIMNLSIQLELLSAGILVTAIAYYRVFRYRSRLLIYYKILEFLYRKERSDGPLWDNAGKISHIMLHVRLETRQCQKYMKTLIRNGFITKGENQVYKLTNKGKRIVESGDVRLLISLDEQPEEGV